MKKLILFIASLLMAQMATFAQYGTLDPTFGNDGYAYMDIAPFGGGCKIHALPNGKILVVAYAVDNSTDVETISIIRYNNDGTIDNSFGTNGVKNTGIMLNYDYGFGDATWAGLDWVTFYPDGSTVLAVPDAIDPNTCTIYKLDTSGNMDNSFNGTGRLPISIPGHDLFPDQWAIGLQSDGKILYASATYKVENSEMTFGPLLVRYNSDGSLDQSFNNTGYWAYSDLGNMFFTGFGVIQQSDGKILFAGAGDDDSCVVIRFNANGSIDNTYGENGIAAVNDLVKMYHWADGNPKFAYDPYTNKAIVAGYAINYQDISVCRFLPNGSLDPGFNGTGNAIYDYNDEHSRLFSILVQPDSKIILSGVGGGEEEGGLLVIRTNSDGQKDNTFGTNGVAVVINNASGVGSSFQNDKLLLTGSIMPTDTASDIFIFTARLSLGASMSLEESPLLRAISLSPNPNNGSFTLNTSYTHNEPLKVTVTDIFGRKIKETSAEANGETVIQLDAPAGVYFVTVASETAKQTEKIVVE